MNPAILMPTVRALFLVAMRRGSLAHPLIMTRPLLIWIRLHWRCLARRAISITNVFAFGPSAVGSFGAPATYGIQVRGSF